MYLLCCGEKRAGGNEVRDKEHKSTDRLSQCLLSARFAITSTQLQSKPPPPLPLQYKWPTDWSEFKVMVTMVPCTMVDRALCLDPT